VIGVQDLKYGFSGGKVGFDISVNWQFIYYDLFVEVCDYTKIPRVPELYRGPYDYDALKAAAEGMSTIDPSHIREGGVMRPLVEMSTPHNDRICYKFIGEAYILRKGGSENH
jgi:hypothetical protein